jgi:invasion protein IalB
MAHYRSQLLASERICRAGAAVLALTIGIGSSTANVAAQQAPAKKTAPASAAAASAALKAPWVKVCEKTPVGIMYNNGKEEMRYRNSCLTQHERLDDNTGMPLVSTAVRHMDGEEKQYFMVMVPLGMRLPAGMRASLYPKGLFEQAQKNEKIDETKLKGLKLEYTLCHAAGCMAEIEATPELINELKTFGGMVVFAINSANEAVAFAVPLSGFEKAFTGEPVDGKQYLEARKREAEQKKKQAEGPPAASPTPKK